MPRFLYYALRAAAKGSAFDDGHLSTIAHLTGDKLRAHRFPFPPANEQAAIVRFLDQASADFDRTSEAAKREIALLREYRTRLIADVVTGKLDVREAAAKLPDEGEELEELPMGDEALDETAAEEDLPSDVLAEEEVAA